MVPRFIELRRLFLEEADEERKINKKRLRHGRRNSGGGNGGDWSGGGGGNDGDGCYSGGRIGMTVAHCE